MARPVLFGDIAIILGVFFVDILDQHRDRRAGRNKRVALLFKDAGQYLDLVRLAALGDEARLSGPAAVELGLDIAQREADAGQHAVDHAAERCPVAFAPGRHPERWPNVLCDIERLLLARAEPGSVLLAFAATVKRMPAVRYIGSARWRQRHGGYRDGRETDGLRVEANSTHRPKPSIGRLWDRMRFGRMAAAGRHESPALLFDPRPGGGYRMALYEQADHPRYGKTSEHADVVEARSAELTPNVDRTGRRVRVRTILPSPGEMTMTWSLTAASEGMMTTIFCENACGHQQGGSRRRPRRRWKTSPLSSNGLATWSSRMPFRHGLATSRFDTFAVFLHSPRQPTKNQTAHTRGQPMRSSMRTLLAALAATLVFTGAALAAQAEGHIKKIDSDNLTITLDDGKILQAAGRVRHGVDQGRDGSADRLRQDRRREPHHRHGTA